MEGPEGNGVSLSFEFQISVPQLSHVKESPRDLVKGKILVSELWGRAELLQFSQAPRLLAARPHFEY